MQQLRADALSCPAQKPKEVDLQHLKQLSEQAKVNVPFHSLHPEDAPPQSLLERADTNLNGALSVLHPEQSALIWNLKLPAGEASQQKLMQLCCRRGMRNPLLLAVLTAHDAPDSETEI
jgi:hypothetical protein